MGIERLEDLVSYWPYAAFTAGMVAAFIVGRVSKSSEQVSPYSLDGKVQKEGEANRSKDFTALEEYTHSSVPDALSGRIDTEVGYRISGTLADVGSIGENFFVGSIEDEHGRAPFSADISYAGAEYVARLWVALKDAERTKARVQMLVQPGEDGKSLQVDSVRHKVGENEYDIRIES